MGAWLQNQDLREILSLEDCQSVSNSAEFELISNFGESHSKLFNSGFISYRETCRDGFE